MQEATIDALAPERFAELLPAGAYRRFLAPRQLTDAMDLVCELPPGPWRQRRTATAVYGVVGVGSVPNRAFGR
jgi:hypothetical protein